MDDADPDAPADTLSFIKPIGYFDSSSCGYCHKEVTGGSQSKRFSYYASTRSLSPVVYQHMVDRCWRRSGTLLYRPNQRTSCCPHYTIRLDATAFHVAKEHRQAVNRFNRHIIGDAYANEAARVRPLSREEAKRRSTTFDLCERIHDAESSKLPSLPPHRTPRTGQGPKTNDGNEPKPSPAKALLPIKPAHRFEVTLERDTFTDEKYEVFQNYQRVVHKEPESKISEDGFRHFLCASPLRRETITGRDGRPKQLGSFHQCYRLDGRLVAVGVLDLLPDCVSAVYFMYHECMNQHSPGKLSALREISLAIEGGYRWWYSGYYIHSCAKMRYKIDFAPQYVLDPETYTWDLLDKETLAIFDRQAYVSLSRERQRKEQGGQPADDPETADTYTDGPLTVLSNGQKSMPLFASNMPGLPTLDDVAKFKLDNVMATIERMPRPFPVKYFTSWPTGSATDGLSIKSKAAELVALVGPDLAHELCLDFGQ